MVVLPTIHHFFSRLQRTPRHPEPTRTLSTASAFYPPPCIRPELQLHVWGVYNAGDAQSRDVELAAKIIQEELGTDYLLHWWEADWRRRGDMY